MELFRLFGRIFIDDKEAKKGLKDTRDEVNKTAKSFKGMGSLLGKLAIGGTILKVGKDSIKAGSDIEELSNKFNVVFGDSRDEVNKWSEEYGRAIKRSKFQIQEYLAGQQDILTGLGLNTDASADLSQGIVKLGFDLASFQNLSDDEAQARLASALRGSSEAASGFGADISQATLKQTDYFKSTNKSWNELTQLEKIQIRYNAILDQSVNALDDAEETSGSFANSVKGLEGAWFDLTAEIGKQALPKLTEFVQYTSDTLIPGIKDIGSSILTLNDESLAKLIESFSDFAKIVLPDLFDRIINFTLEVGPDMADTFKKISTTATKLFKIAGRLYEALKPLFDIVQEVGIKAFKSLNEELQELIDQVNELLTFIEDVFEGRWDAAWKRIGDSFVFSWESALKRVVKATTKSFTTISNNPILGNVLKAASQDIGKKAGAFFQGLATGGQIEEGGMFRVGEKGPENVFLPAGSAVIPNSANGMMSGNNIKVEINNPVMTDERMIDQIGEQLVGVLKSRGVVVQGG